MKVKRKQISLFGNFGRGNFGNDCTLQAMVHNVRQHLPDAELRCICKGPEATSSRHEIAAVPMREMPIAMLPRPDRKALRLLRRILVGIPTEVYRCVKAVQTLKDTDMLVMTGTGMFSDFGILPFGLHYDILRWSLIAKVCRCQLLFVSVGAGPIDHPMSRRFVKWALALGDYRSYRDTYSKHYLESIGFETNGDGVYPDLAFSLPRTLIPGHPTHDSRRPVVAVGLMAYYDRHHTLDPSEAIHREYVAKLATFVTWLLEHQYTVRLMIGDVWYDRRVRRELRQVLEERHVQSLDEQLVDAPVASAEDVLSQLATADVVVASRFHNVLMALMLGKPVVAISYHEKVDALMDGLGLEAYCHDIDRFETGTLIEQFTALERNAAAITTQIRQKTEAFRAALDDQYDRIFSTAGSQP